MSLQKNNPAVEILKWGNIQIPAILYTYASELDLDATDLGLIGAVFGAYQLTQPLLTLGVEIGHVLKVCPSITKSRVIKRLSKWEELGLVNIENGDKEFMYRKIHIDPLFFKLRELIIRDHPLLQQYIPQNTVDDKDKTINELKYALQLERSKNGNSGNNDLKLIVDFIAEKTANPINVQMANEIRKWLNEYGFSSQVILCMLELCFERKITRLKDIQNIANGLKERSIVSLQDIEAYFKGRIDKVAIPSNKEIYEFETFSGIDMSAQARKAIYNKWRYEWGFDQDLILLAANKMCLQTKNGSLNYIESILKDWKNQQITTVAQAEDYQATRKANNPPKESQGKNGRKQKQKDSTSLEDPKHEKFFNTTRLV